MALIDLTYFKGIITIDSSRPDSETALLEYIDIFEVDYLKKLLGNKQYYDYVANPESPKYVSLLTPTKFEYGGETYENDVLTMIAYFVYFHYINDMSGQNTPIGEVQLNDQNATQILPVNKLVRAYNLGVDLYEIAEKYILANITDFADIKTERIDRINSFGI